MTNLLVPIVAASLVGSLHCAGMCGGLVAFATGGSEGSLRRRAVALAAYNGARGAGYVMIGALAGALGGAVDDVGVRLGIGRTAAILAGAIMLAWGATRLLEAGGVTLARLGLPAGIQQRPHSAMKRAAGKPLLLRASVVGGCTAALPCGWLHAFTVVAGGTGSAKGGAAVMAAFWIGTLPALLGLGLGVQSLTARLRRHASVISAVALVCVGLASVLGRVRLPFPPSPTPSGALSPARAGVIPDLPPCHAHHAH